MVSEGKFHYSPVLYQGRRFAHLEGLGWDLVEVHRLEETEDNQTARVEKHNTAPSKKAPKG